MKDPDKYDHQIISIKLIDLAILMLIVTPLSCGKKVISTSSLDLDNADLVGDPPEVSELNYELVDQLSLTRTADLYRRTKTAISKKPTCSGQIKAHQSTLLPKSS